MSLLLDLAGAFRGVAPRNETLPPVPYTGPGGGFSLYGRNARPTARQLDLTTTESTLYSVIDLISGDVGNVAWDLYRGRRAADMCPPDGAMSLTEEQSLAVKLWHHPNDFMEGNHLRTINAWHFDAVGEAWQVCDFLAPNVPGSFWPVRPDRMDPVTHPDKYLLGYTYTGPSGERIPLELNEVLRITRPHPLDPHRGVGPVPALMLPLTTSLTSQQWMQAFYDNDATPGGMVELGQEQIMDDGEWKAFTTRWNEQHRGVSRAHRVGILEIGKFTPTQMDLRKLQVTELRHLTRDQVLEAYRIHKHMIGASDDVNRAAAIAADETYARRVLLRRVKDWFSFANGPYLRCFGSTGRGVVWCPENVVPENDEAANDERDSIANAAKTLAEAGFPLAQIADYFDLPFELTDSGASPQEIAVLVQKMYLGVGKLGEANVVLSTTEARRVLEQAGAKLDAWEPDPPKQVNSERVDQLPPAPPQQLPPAADPNELDGLDGMDDHEA
jgi:phage portal protein BeeE